MKNYMQSIALGLVFVSIAIQCAKTQCLPQVGESCNSSVGLCSLSELNGYSCSNSSAIPGHCTTMCSQGGTTDNTSWWSFISGGGAASLTLTVGNCNAVAGLEFGIMKDCKCGQNLACRSVPCVPPGSSATLNVNLSACYSYSIWIDGCNGDICDFTISTTGGNPPVLEPLGFINNEPSGIIQPVCEGQCNYQFFVNNQPGELCYFLLYYDWTLDGVPIGSRERIVALDFPDAGDFEICVTARIRNPKDYNIICAEQGPRCATVIVRPLPDRIGQLRKICWDAANPSGYKWHSQRIYASGTYREQLLVESECCPYDSVVEFIVLEEPESPPVFYFSCDNKPYTDAVGKKHSPCLYQEKIKLPKISNPFKCDSSISLTAINMDYAPTWNTKCNGGMIELIPDINILNPCDFGESYEFEYNWFKKSQPSVIISREERIFVPPVSEEYCLQVTVVVALGSEVALCTKIFCESFNESNLTPDCSFGLQGSKIYCFDPLADYWIDSFFAKNVNFYAWSVQGGILVSNPDSSVVKVEWSLLPQDSGKICASYNTDCGMSCEKCITVKPETHIAGFDYKKRGLSAYLDARPGPNGIWRLISGPYNVTIQEPSNPRTKISAYNYGVYCFEWTVSDTRCLVRDTLCVELHSFPKTSPEYPELLFFDRSSSVDDEDGRTEIIFTPNLIDSRGESVVTVRAISNDEMNYSWFDIFGRIISQGNQIIESGLQKVQILSPVKPGMYFLLIDLNGLKTVRRVCVME